MDNARIDTTADHKGFGADKAAGALTLGALAFLIILHRAFRSVLGG